MYRRRLSYFSLLLICACACSLVVAQTARRPLKLDDLSRFRNVNDPQISPDGKWVAYVVQTTDTKEDRSNSHIWMVGIDGNNNRQITFSEQSENSPRFSPDGRYLSFTSPRPGKTRGNQVWLLDRNGGEAMQLTEIKGRLQGHEWSPDSKRLALVIGDPDPEADAAPSPQPGATPRVLPALRPQHVHLSFRHRDQKTRAVDEEQVGREFAVVVTRWKAHRFHE
jgi:dipeptidyl aminopeptidase/acylaminoacyl peptidase